MASIDPEVADNPRIFEVEVHATDESPLLPKTGNHTPDEEPPPTSSSNQATPGTASIISLLLIGVFMANADGTLILSTYATIASEFHQLSNGSWLATSFVLATCAAQPIAGRMSDIYGRKSVLLVSYVLFILGTIGSGVGLTMSQVIAGRLIAGVGGGGMTVLVSILITDLVPKLQVAAWRSYVNVAATVGRSLGGPIGGFLADTVGWRWSFISQVPLVILATIFIAFKLKTPIERTTSSANYGSKLGQIDFTGALLLVGSIVTLLSILDLGGQKTSWSSPIIICLAIVATVFGAAFCWYDLRFARLPIFYPGLLLQRSVWTSYSIAMLQIAAQVGMLFSVPMYFQITEGASNSAAGFHLIPAVLGNTVGGLTAGFVIAKTGRYKMLTVLATLSGIACYLVLIFRWQGRVSIFESLEIFPGGFGTGMAGASTFIVLASDIAPENMAMGTSGMYLAANIGQIAGISMSFAVQQDSLRSLLQKSLLGEDSRKIIHEVLSDISRIREAEEPIKSILIQCYLKSLENSHVAALCCSALALTIALSIKEHPLHKETSPQS